MWMMTLREEGTLSQCRGGQVGGRGVDPPGVWMQVKIVPLFGLRLDS